MTQNTQINNLKQTGTNYRLETTYERLKYGLLLALVRLNTI